MVHSNLTEMGNIKYKSAGAGSGKTYFLTHKIAELLKQPGVTGDQMIVTTFTKAAAADVRTRAKKVVYNDPELSERAGELDQALIGTVHSIANTFLSRYWYKVGISPETRILDEAATDVYLSESLADPTFVSPADRAFFNRFREKFGITVYQGNRTVDNYHFWQDDIKNLVTKISAYSMDSDAVDASRKYSLGLVDEILGKGVELPCAQDILDAADKLKEILDKNIFTIDTTGARRGLRKSEDKYNCIVGRIDALKARVNSGGVDKTVIYDFYDEFKIGDANIKKIDEADSDIKKLVLPYQYSECIHDIKDDAVIYIEKIYELTLKFISRYRSFKEQMHYIDYDALEDEFCKLLEDPEVQDDIRSQYRYVLVDEFQDSSPKQVKIFNRLAELTSESYWVGDKKQAIYGFRGTNADLVQSVVNKLQKSGSVSSLKDSYRSVKGLVDASNNIFCRLFNAEDELRPDYKGEKMVYLNCGRTAEFDKENDLPQPLFPKCIYQWSDVSDAAAMAKRIAAMLKGEGCLDPVGGRPLPKDIAVLARTNSELAEVCNELRILGIPVNIAGEKISESDEAKVACAAMRLLDDRSDSTMAAIVAKYLIPGYSTNEIISKMSSERIGGTGKLDEESIMKTIASLSYESRSQSVSQTLEKLLVSLDMYNRVKGLGNAETRKNNLITLCELAEDFEERCGQLSIAATIEGFINFLETNEKKNSGDKSGVTLTTYHSAKGLEWPIVILTSLEKTCLDDERIIGKSMMSGVKDFTKDEETTVILLRKLFDLPGKTNPRYAEKPLVDNCKSTEAYGVIRYSEKEEAKRRFYVGFTRAMNTLIFAGNDFSSLEEMGLDLSAPELGLDIEDACGEPETQDLFYEGTCDIQCVKDCGRIAHDIRDYHPSELEAGKAPHRFDAAVEQTTYKVIEYLGNPSDRISSTTNEADNIFGDCIHHIFGVPEVWKSDPVVQISRIARQYGISFKSEEKVALAWTRLEEYLNRRITGIRNMYHELPFRYRDTEGHVFSGSMDLVVETDEGFFIVDYKTYQGTDLIEHTKKERYAAQLFCYAEALKNFHPDKKILGTAIYYPVSEAVVELVSGSYPGQV